MVRCLITNASFLPIDFRMEDAEILLVDKKVKSKKANYFLIMIISPVLKRNKNVLLSGMSSQEI